MWLPQVITAEHEVSVLIWVEWYDFRKKEAWDEAQRANNGKPRIFTSLFNRHEILQVKNLIFVDFKNGNNYWAELKNWRLQVQSIRIRLLVRNKFMGITFEQYHDIDFKF